MTRLAAICLAASAVAGCGGSPTSPSDTTPLSERIETAHFVFHFASGDRVDAEWEETYHTWAVAQLGVQPPRIDYNKYRSRAHMGGITGRGNTNGYAEPEANRIHTIWATDNHEVVHVYAGPWGSPVALFGEGLAVAHQTNPASGDFTARWNGTALHEWTRRLRASGQLPAIASIAESNAFRARDPDQMYPIAGSFVRFLIDAEGLAPMRRLYGEVSAGASLATVRDAFQRVYGFSLDEAERRWLAFVAGEGSSGRSLVRAQDFHRVEP